MATEGRRHDGIDENTRYIIDAKKNEQYTAQSDQGLLQHIRQQLLLVK